LIAKSVAVIVPVVTCPETSRNCEAREKEDPE
jgi:hypothetical protein